MKIAYLIDRETLGGGCEYVRRKTDERRMRGDECRTFYSFHGECTSAAMDVWGADEIVVNHLKALLQLLGRFWERPRGKVRFVVHGIHLRKYEWMIRERGTREKVRGTSICLLSLYLKRFLRRSLESWLYHRCDEVVALTESDRIDILRLYGEDLKVVVEPNTLDGWEPCLADALPFGVKGPFRYICIGRFDYQKGQDRLIRWLAGEVRRGHIPRATASREAVATGVSPRPAVLFIGDGETLEACRALARRMEVHDLCVFAGAVPDADRYLKCADVVVSPSRWEGMPYLLMKARALGCRILATDCPGNRDVLEGYDRWERLDL